jgi:hypothetical protein
METVQSYLRNSLIAARGSATENYDKVNRARNEIIEEIGYFGYNFANTPMLIELNVAQNKAANRRSAIEYKLLLLSFGELLISDE